MYFNSIREIRETFPKALRLLTKGNRTVCFEPLKSIFIIENNGLETRKTIDEMETLEKSLQSKSGLLIEVKKVFSNKIKPWD